MVNWKKTYLMLYRRVWGAEGAVLQKINDDPMGQTTPWRWQSATNVGYVEEKSSIRTGCKTNASIIFFAALTSTSICDRCGNIQHYHFF